MKTAKTAKKKRARSPTARALEALRKDGHYAWVVESTIPKTFIKRDFMGWADIIFITKANIVGLQVTSHSGGNFSARKKKILAEPRALAWIKAGGLIELWAYYKDAEGKWQNRKEEIVEADFA